MTSSQEPDVLDGRSVIDREQFLKQRQTPQQTQPSANALSAYPISNSQEKQAESRFSCYLIGDRTAVVQDVIKRHGGEVMQAHGWHPFRGRRSATGNRLLHTLAKDLPTVLWIHLDSRQAYTQNPMHHTAVKQLASIVGEQQRAGRMVVIEGSWAEVNWNSAARQLMGPSSQATCIHWCGLDIKHDRTGEPMHAVHAICMMNAPTVEAMPCACGKRRQEKHDHDHSSYFDQFMVWFLRRLGLVTTEIPRTLGDAPRRQALTTIRTTKQVLSLDGALALDASHTREEVGRTVPRGQPDSSQPGPRGNVENQAESRQGSTTDLTVDPPQSRHGDAGIKQSPDHSGKQNSGVSAEEFRIIEDLKSDRRESTGVHVHFTQVNQPIRVTTHEGTNFIAMPDHSIDNVRQLQTTTHNTYNTTATQLKHTTSTQTKVSVFPTEQRMRAKKKEELLKAMGKDPKLQIKRKKILQEAHYDDCGSDFGGIAETKATVTFADAILYCFDKIDYSSCESNSSDAEERLADDLINQAYLTWMGFGSDASEATLKATPATSVTVHADKLLTYLTCSALAGYVDIVEFCGGQAGVSRLAIRRRLKTGLNADIICGIDLMKEKDRATFIKYVEQHKPLVIIGAPPCTAMCGWSHYNRTMHKETFDKNRKIGENIANLFAKICLLQMTGRRHWLVENPLGSDMFRLKAWLELEPFAHKVVVHQCLLGLIDQDGTPVRKATEFWASTWVLIYRLDGYLCDKKHVAVSGTSKGQDRCDFVKVWPRRLCQLLVAGIEELRRMPKLAYANVSQFQPVEEQIFVCNQPLHATPNKPLPNLAARHLVSHSNGILLVQQLSDTATIPTKGSQDAAGFDMAASAPTIIENNSRGMVSTGLAVAIPTDAYGRIAPRSGLAVEQGITVGAGVIDADYRGEVKILLFNHGNKPLVVQTGDRIAQLIIEKIAHVQIELAKQLPPSHRGKRGFGSTGKSRPGSSINLVAAYKPMPLQPEVSPSDRSVPQDHEDDCRCCDIHFNGHYPIYRHGVWRCKMCRQNKRSDHPKHTRLPGHCRYHSGNRRTTRAWSCPGCLADKPRGHPDHQEGPTCQWTTASRRPNAGPRDGQPRDPASRHAEAEDLHTEGLRADMVDGALAAEDEAPARPSPETPRADTFEYPEDPDIVPAGVMQDLLDTISFKKGWHDMPGSDDKALVCYRLRFFKTCVPDYLTSTYPYRSVYVGFPGCWLIYEDHVKYMLMSEKKREGPLRARKDRVIHIFHKQPKLTTPGGDPEAPPQIRDRDGPPSDGVDAAAADRWEIRGDRVIRVVNVPRTHTTVPTGEPDACPLEDSKLTEKRVTRIKLVNPTDSSDWRTVIDSWKHESGEMVSPRRQKLQMTNRSWTGEIIFEMNEEEKLRRNLHRSQDIEAEQIGEGALVPTDAPDEQIQVIQPKRRKRGEELVLHDEGAQADKRAEDWTGFDVGNALARLRSDRESVRLRALRQLHLRWFHATIEQMRKILTAAGVPKDVLDKIPFVVHTCRICRRWERHSPKAQVSVRLADKFNEVVQFDIIEYLESDKKWYIIHLIDDATRFSTADVYSSKDTYHVMEAFYFCWIRTFGPMQTIISDQEGALTSHEFASFLARHDIQVKLKPKNTKAFTVERHNSIVREGMHRLYDLCVLNCLAVPLRHRLFEVIFFKNAMLQYGGFSPYNSVIGQQPALLPNIENTNTELAEDDRTGHNLGSNRGAVRLRELALEAVQQSCAYSRALRASNSRTREAGQLKELELGQLVDFWRKQPNKEDSGWIGPASVCDKSGIADEGVVWVRYMGRPISCRTLDVRPHLALLAFMCVLFSSKDAMSTVLNYLEQMKPHTSVILLAHRIQNRWELTRTAKEMAELYEAVLFIGNMRFGVTNCIGARLVRGRQKLQGLEIAEVTEAPIYYYTPPQRDEYFLHNLDNPRLTVHLDDVIRGYDGQDKGNFSYNDDYCFVQFIGVSGDTRQEVVKQIPNLPCLAGQGSPDISLTPRSTASWDSMTPSSDSLNRPHMANNDFEQSADGPPRCCPREDSGRSVPQDPYTPDDTSMEEAYHVLQHFGPQALEIPSTMGWQSWTSEEQRKNELYVWFKDLIPKATDDPTLEDILEGDTEVNENLQQILKQRKAPQQITHEGYLAVTEAMHTEPCYAVAAADKAAPPGAVEETDETSIAFEGIAAYCHLSMHNSEFRQYVTVDPQLLALPKIDNQEAVVVETWYKPNNFKSKSDFKHKVTIEKELNNLGPQEIADNKQAVLAADLKELKQLFDLGTFQRMKRKDAKNIVDVRWVRKWKKDPHTLEKFVKSRLTVRGFKDLCQELETYAGTATRWAQRLIVALAVLLNLPMFTIDVTGAFAKGLNWEELAKLTGEMIRSVQFELTRPEDVALIRRLEGFADFDPHTEVLDMIKAIYGLKDAPRAWRMRLHQILVEACLKQLRHERELYVQHEALRGQPQIMADRTAPQGRNDAERGSSASGRTVPRGRLNESTLSLAATSHVDDLKCIGGETASGKMIAVIEKAVGKITLLKDNFEHCGIKHETSEKAITLHQNHYAAQLRPIDESLLGSQKEDVEVKEFNIELVTLFMSLLGGLAWLVLTRLDICIYVQCMQRHAQNPRVEDVRKLNRLLRWVQKRPAGIVYFKRKGQELLWRLQAVSDSAFRSLEDNTTGLALRGFVIMLTVCHGDHPGGDCIILDYGTKKHKRVNRSTYAAELNAVVDTVDVATIVQFVLEEIFNPGNTAPEVMQDLYLQGKLKIPMEVCLDAKAVFDSISVQEYNMPAESTLVNHLHSIREMVRDGRISRLWWIDTRDMVADGLNKGGLPRDPILAICEKGSWILNESGISFPALK